MKDIQFLTNPEEANSREGPHREPHMAPERLLLCAMLHRAILDSLGFAKLSPFYSEEDRESCVPWIMSDEYEPFTFLWVCGYIGIPLSRIKKIRKVISEGSYETRKKLYERLVIIQLLR